MNTNLGTEEASLVADLKFRHPLGHNGAVDVFEEIVRLKRAGKRAALATIVRRLGSTPRKDHAKMLIREDSTTIGSVGGGCVEAEVWDQARRVIEEGRARFVTYEMKDDDAENEGLVCGGTVEIFVEPILPDPTLLILGAGHLGQAISAAALPLGFKVNVLDDRKTFASQKRFPGVHQIEVDEFDRGLQHFSINSNTFILVVTRGHRYDQIALEKAIQTEAGYVGMVGSRRKIKLIVEALIEKGIPVQRFRRLYAPIGLPIGSETPEEIAVSVLAELIALRKGVHQLSEKQQFVRSLVDPSRHLAPIDE